MNDEQLIAVLVELTVAIDTAPDDVLRNRIRAIACDMAEQLGVEDYNERQQVLSAYQRPN